MWCSLLGDPRKAAHSDGVSVKLFCNGLMHAATVAGASEKRE
jgi:hypothetical protein